MKHPIIKKILTEWSYRVHDGMPDVNNPMHLVHLKESLQHLNIDEDVIDLMMNKLYEDDIVKNKKSGNTYVVKTHNSETQDLIKKDASKEDIEKVKDDKEDDTETTTSTGGSTSENIDSIDGDAKEGGMNKEVKAPGNDTSTVNEIGVGYALACMEEEPDNFESCLDKKLDATKLGKKASKRKRKQIILSHFYIYRY